MAVIPVDTYSDKQRIVRLIRQKKILNARRNLRAFTTYTKPDYRVAPFHDIIFEKAEAFAKGEIKRLIVMCPPRHGKTEVISRRLPAFCFGINPDEQIIACSYSDDLVTRNNRDVQRIIDSAKYNDIFPDVKLWGKNVKTLADNSFLRNSSIFEIVDHAGVYRSAGIGSGITGMGFTKGIIDDYLKDAKEAESPVVRESIWEWYTSTFLTRAAPGAGICVIATRWNEDDLIGRLLKLAKEDPTADQWEVIKLPAIAEDDLEPYDLRMPGEALWEEQYSLERLKQIRATLGTYQFSALFQQSPSAREGNVIKREWYNEVFIIPKDIKAVELYWDMGASDAKEADYTAGTLGVMDSRGRITLIRQVAGQWNPNTRNQRIQDFCLYCKRYYPDVQVHIEGGIGIGKETTDALQMQLFKLGINVQIDRVTKSKYLRADLFFAMSEAKKIDVYAGELPNIKDNHLWVSEFFSEVTRLQFKKTESGTKFVGGHDDRFDSSVGCCNKLAQPTNWGVEFAD